MAGNFAALMRRSIMRLSRSISSSSHRRSWQPVGGAARPVGLTNLRQNTPQDYIFALTLDGIDRLKLIAVGCIRAGRPVTDRVVSYQSVDRRKRILGIARSLTGRVAVVLCAGGAGTTSTDKITAKDRVHMDTVFR